MLTYLAFHQTQSYCGNAPSSPKAQTAIMSTHSIGTKARERCTPSRTWFWASRAQQGWKSYDAPHMPSAHAWIHIRVVALHIPLRMHSQLRRMQGKVNVRKHKYIHQMYLVHTSEEQGTRNCDMMCSTLNTQNMECSLTWHAHANKKKTIVNNAPCSHRMIPRLVKNTIRRSLNKQLIEAK